MPVELNNEFNGLVVWRNWPWAESCPACGLAKNQWSVPYETEDRPTIRADLSVTADGIEIASKRFKQLYEEAGLSGLKFEPLKNGYFALRFLRTVRYDPMRCYVHKEDWCDTCERYGKNLLWAKLPVLASDEEPIAPNEFVCSEMSFGDKRLRTRNLLAGDGVHEWILKNELKGMAYEEVPQPENARA